MCYGWMKITVYTMINLDLTSGSILKKKRDKYVDVSFGVKYYIERVSSSGEAYRSLQKLSLLKLEEMEMY